MISKRARRGGRRGCGGLRTSKEDVVYDDVGTDVGSWDAVGKGLDGAGVGSGVALGIRVTVGADEGAEVVTRSTTMLSRAMSP